MTYSTTHTPPEELDTFTLLTGAHDGFQKGEAMTEETKPAALVVLERLRAEEAARKAEAAALREAKAALQEAKASHDAQFITITNLVERFRCDDRFISRTVVFETLRADDVPLLCLLVLNRDDGPRCMDPVTSRWGPLPTGPVVSRYRFGQILQGGSDDQCYTLPANEDDDSPADPLAAALLLTPAGSAGFSSDALAIRIEDAVRLFGPQVVQVPARPEFAVIQSEPTPEPEQPPSPAWKIGKYWTDAAKDQMRQQRVDGWNDGRIAKHWKFERQNVARLIGSQAANKAKANTPKP